MTKRRQPSLHIHWTLNLWSIIIIFRLPNENQIAAAETKDKQSPQNEKDRVGRFTRPKRDLSATCIMYLDR